MKFRTTSRWKARKRKEFWENSESNNNKTKAAVSKENLNNNIL